MTSDADVELIAQKVSALGEQLVHLQERVDDAEAVNARLEAAALIMARSLEEISSHWDAVYRAMRRAE
jgi:hypothetical protein